jgi:hypothetical protein
MMTRIILALIAGQIGPAEESEQRERWQAPSPLSAVLARRNGNLDVQKRALSVPV